MPHKLHISSKGRGRGASPAALRAFQEPLQHKAKSGPPRATSNLRAQQQVGKHHDTHVRASRISFCLRIQQQLKSKLPWNTKTATKSHMALFSTPRTAHVFVHCHHHTTAMLSVTSGIVSSCFTKGHGLVVGLSRSGSWLERVISVFFPGQNGAMKVYTSTSISGHPC